MKVKPCASNARPGLPIDLRPGQSLILADGELPLAGLQIVPVEFGAGRVRLLVRHPAGRVVRERQGAIHELSIQEQS